MRRRDQTLLMVSLFPCPSSEIKIKVLFSCIAIDSITALLKMQDAGSPDKLCTLFNVASGR